MNSTTAPLTVRRTFKATRERVFRAWTDPKALAQWWHAGPDMEPGVCEVDLRTGGKYTLKMKNKVKGIEHVTVGVFLEVVEPERLVYTWNWLNGPPGTVETRVTVEFLPRGSETELVLTHSGFTEEPVRENHGKGWGACLAELDALLQSGK